VLDKHARAIKIYFSTVLLGINVHDQSGVSEQANSGLELMVYKNVQVRGTNRNFAKT